MFKRRLQLPPPGSETFFLWGPIQTGKTTLLRATSPNALWIDLLKAEDGILILPAGEFCSQLNSGDLF
jgi:uncharacterized protein